MSQLLKLRAVIETAPEAVAAVLLDVRPGGRSPLAVTGTIEETDVGDQFEVVQDGSRITVAVDRAARSVTIEGAWWYRGVTSVEPGRAAQEHFGWMGPFFSLDVRASHALTSELLGWEPTHAGLLDDLEAGSYFTA